MTQTDRRIPVALTIAGSDSSGGAGLQADLKTFTVLGVYGASVVTAVTAQNTCGVQGVQPIGAAFVEAQLDSVLGDLRVVAAKTGMLATPEVVASVAQRLGQAPDIALVVDPVMVATSGDLLLAEAAIDVYRTLLLPRALLVTPNLPEAAKLLDEGEAQSLDDCIRQAKALGRFGCRAVLLKGGHGHGPEVVDVLWHNAEVELFRHPRAATINTHGTGCTLSAAITAQLVLGDALREAVAGAIVFVERALVSGAAMVVGRQHGPVDHLFLRDRSSS